MINYQPKDDDDQQNSDQSRSRSNNKKITTTDITTNNSRSSSNLTPLGAFGQQQQQQQSSNAEPIIKTPELAPSSPQQRQRAPLFAPSPPFGTFGMTVVDGSDAAAGSDDFGEHDTTTTATAHFQPILVPDSRNGEMVRMHSISFLPQYDNKSFEEIRYEKTRGGEVP